MVPLMATAGLEILDLLDEARAASELRLKS
jgi:hypothetical protein